MRIERFIEKLVRPLYLVVAPQMKTFLSYLATIDCAWMLEMKEIEMCALQDKTKKVKIQSSFGGQTSGAIKKG